MSWVDPESGGADGGMENPDPEEDSDLPGRRLDSQGPRDGEAEGHAGRPEQDRPEDDLAMSTVDPAVGASNGAGYPSTGANEQEGPQGGEQRTEQGVDQDRPEDDLATSTVRSGSGGAQAGDQVCVPGDGGGNDERLLPGGGEVNSHNTGEGAVDQLEFENGPTGAGGGVENSEGSEVVAAVDENPHDTCDSGSVEAAEGSREDEARPYSSRPTGLVGAPASNERPQAVQHPDRSPVDAGVEEEDSFEQDDETAAPECENEVLQDSTSESDRQPIHSHSHAGGDGGHLANAQNCLASAANAVPAAQSGGRNSDNLDLSGLGAAGNGEVVSGAAGEGLNNLGSFSGNVEVADSAEDAPEAELDNLQSNLNTGHIDGEAGGYSLPPLAANPESHAQTTGNPSSDHSNPDTSRLRPGAGEDHDMQAPECDRGNSPQPPPHAEGHISTGEAAQPEAVSHSPHPPLHAEEHISVGEAAQPGAVSHSPQPPLHAEGHISMGEAAQPEAVSQEQAPCDNHVAGDVLQEAIAPLPSSMCQHENTSEFSGEGTASQKDPQRDIEQGPNPSGDGSELRLETGATNADENGLVEAQQNSIDREKTNGQTGPSEPHLEQFTSNNNDATSLSPPASSTESSDCAGQAKYSAKASHDLGNADIQHSAALNDATPTSTPSASPTGEPPTNASSSGLKEEPPTASGSASLPNLPSTIPNTARHKEDGTGSQKFPSNNVNSSSSSSSNSSQRTSPAKAVAAALFHVMGMDSKFTGKDLAMALQSDDEDDLMNELDAELLSMSATAAAKPKQVPQKQQQQQQSQSQRREHHKPRSKPSSARSGPSPKVNGLPSSQEVLQEHNRQLLEQLRIRDEEIARLSAEQKSEERAAGQGPSSHSADDLYLPQIKELEKTIAQQGAEIKSLTEKLYTHDATAKRTVLSLQNEMKARVDQATKMYEDCRKEKDKMVVKFAEAEAKNMEAKRVAEKSEGKVRDAYRERDNMASGLKAARNDRQKAISNLDAKSTEVSNLHKELEKMKEAINSAEYRIKWFQNKLKDELDAHKETKGNVEKTNLRLKEAREETELIRKECQAIVKRYQESEEIKSNTLEKDLKLKESELQTHLQERNDSEELHQMLKQELDSLKGQHKDTLEEAKTLRDKVKCLEEERQQNHDMIENYQEIMQKQKSDNTDLTSKLNSLANLDDDYQRAQTMIQSLDKDIADLKVSNKDLQKDMDSCRERESKMLTLQSELSRANAMLRSENTNLSNKSSTLTSELEMLRMESQRLDAQVKELSESLELQKTKHQENTEHLVASLTEKTKESSDFKQKWEDEMDNSKTLKRRHANNIKDLTRQLQQARRKLEAHDGKADGGSMGSRTNSNGSLNSVDNSQHNHHNQQAAPVTSPQEFPVITEQVEVDKNVLIERIVRLQKSHARKNEKLEFLGEHIQQLLEEIKKKNKIIQNYALREEAGTLSSDDMDAHKELIDKTYKTLLSRKGGIMASVYSVHQQDGSMTLDLSLQINKKLQAVLEDTLLKNITLKENLDTLGEEIARLSQENRRLQLRLQELEGRPR